ncbi:hypothetical protein HYN59_04645 [Flavobacterium album]|uniref:Uncharacterized protein n=1 Tax=Flavobacterium album TaxID=2175091 RepID=A0A2S1QVM0_9FLAO|nr:flippase [Flavobacterium album]AWH84448.1 hypothetical protein HYN59_04645 [Flavobacterium album]
MNGDIKKIISSSGINFLFRIFGLGATFFSMSLIGKVFGAETFGNYSLVFTISQAAAMLFALGIPNALIKIVGNNSLSFPQAKKILKQGLKVTLLVSVIPMLIFFAGAEFIATEIFDNKKLENYFLIITISLPLFIFHELFLYFFIATKNFMRYSILMFVLPNFLLLAFLYLFYSLGYAEHYTFIAFALSIMLVVATEAFLVFEIKPDRTTSIISTKELVKTASPMMFSGILLYLLNWTDLIIVGIMMDEKQVGIYNYAFRAGSLGFLVIISVNTIIMPKMAELYGKGDLSGLKKMVHSTTRMVALLSLPITAGLILLAPFILSFFGAEAVEGTSAMIIVAVGVFFSAAMGNVDQILNMSNNAKIFGNITLVCFFVNALLNLTLIPAYGINGSAIASLLTNVLMNIVCVIYIKKKLGFYTLI